MASMLLNHEKNIPTINWRHLKWTFHFWAFCRQKSNFSKWPLAAILYFVLDQNGQNVFKSCKQHSHNDSESIKEYFSTVSNWSKNLFFQNARHWPIFLGMSPKRIGVVLRVKRTPWLSLEIFNERFFKLERPQTKLTRWAVAAILDFLPKFFFRQTMSLG